MHERCKTSVNVVSTLLGLTGWTKVLGFNPKRIAIILSPNGASPVTYNFLSSTAIPVAASPPGICVNQSNIILKIGDLGNIIQQEFFASDGGNGSVVAVTEVFDPGWEN